MEGNSQTSFIPKKPIISQESSYEDRGVSIVTILAMIVFIGVVTLSVGSYLYHKYLISELKDKQETLEKAKAGFDLETIKDLKRTDTRIESAKLLLEQHIAASAFFDLLESATLVTVRFSDLTIKTENNASVGGAAVNDNPLADNNSATSINFKMSGAAKSYNSVALESDLFNKTKGFKEPIFSNLNLNEKGEVGFTVSALLEPQVLRYRTVMGLQRIETVNTAPPAEETTNTSPFNETSQ